MIFFSFFFPPPTHTHLYATAAESRGVIEHIG